MWKKVLSSQGDGLGPLSPCMSGLGVRHVWVSSGLFKCYYVHYSDYGHYLLCTYCMLAIGLGALPKLLQVLTTLKSK